MESLVLRFAGGGKPNAEPLKDASEFRIVQRWGVTSQPVRELSDFDPGQPLEGVLGVNGEWWLMARDPRGRMLIMADPSSMQPLFYAAVWTSQGSDLLVGSQLDSTSQAMKALGAKIETDWAGLLPSLSSRNDFFDTMHDVLTPVARLLVNRPDQALLVDEHGFRRVARPEPVALASLQYEELLRRGAERAGAEIVTALEANGAERATINLSGGKDSRLVLGLCVASGLASRVQAHSVDPRGATPAWREKVLTADLEISSRLVARYGLSWAPAARKREVWPDTLNGQLFAFQRFRGGRSYQFFVNPQAYAFTEPEVRLTGAGAEFIRSHWADEWTRTTMWNSFGGTPESFNADALAVYRFVEGKSSVPEDVRRRAMNRLVVTLREISDGTIQEALAAHYRSFRNRGHVGGALWSRSMGIVTVNPLMQPEFLVASRMLSRGENDAGRITYDLLEMIAPELNDLEFQSGPWPWADDRAAKFDWSKYPANRVGYFEARKLRESSKLPEFPVGPRPDMLPLIKAGLLQLRDALNADNLPSDAILGDLLQKPPIDARGQGRLLTKLATWAHSMPDSGAFAASAIPLAPRIVNVTPEKVAPSIP